MPATKATSLESPVFLDAKPTYVVMDLNDESVRLSAEQIIEIDKLLLWEEESAKSDSVFGRPARR